MRLNQTTALEAVNAVIADLTRIDERLTEVTTSLSTQTAATVNLRGIIECVQSDLLDDAIETLSVATQDFADPGGE